MLAASKPCSAKVESAAQQHRQSATADLAEPPQIVGIETGQETRTAARPAEPTSTAAPETADPVAEARRRFQTIDKNGDERIDRVEFRLASVRALDLIDINRDGYVTIDETLLAQEAFERFDTNGDGRISALEFVNADTLRAIDSDGDGVVTLDEYLDLVRASAR